MANKAWKFNKDFLLAVFAAIIIVLVVLLASKTNTNSKSQQNSNSKTSTVAVTPSGMKYPAGWQEATQITASEKQGGVISKATHSNTSATAVIKLISGQLDKDVDINKLSGPTIAKLKSTRKNFELVNSSVITLGKNKAVNITYIDSIGQLNFKHSQTIVPTANKTYYLTVTARVSDYSKLQKDFNAISAAFADFIK